MALKITLKPDERLIIDGAVITNGGSTCSLLIDNNVPILRQKDIMRERDADSPSRRIYFVIQLMYIDTQNLTKYQETYWKLIDELVEAAPRTLGLVDQISEHIICNRYYQALKLAKQLIYFEEEVLNHVCESTAGI